MSRIAAFVPEWHLREIDRVAVSSTPAAALQAFLDLDLYQLPFVRRLFALRALPLRVSALIHGTESATPRSMRCMDIVAPGNDFHLLEHLEDRAVVIGAMGRFWEPSIPVEPVDPATFKDAMPAAKVAWSVEVSPRESGGAWISFEVRVAVAGEAEERAFDRYFRFIGRFSRLMRRGVLRALVKRLGAPDERQMRLAGDDILVPDAVFQHAETFEAPPAQVWPWLLQMGGDRAGWYSYDRLDHGGQPSARAIIPELQALRVGSLVRARPKASGDFAVLRLDAPRALVLGSPQLLPVAEPAAELRAPYAMTWAFVLEPIAGEATRLCVRVRGKLEPDASPAVLPMMRVAHEIMERRQLRGLKERVESARHGDLALAERSLAS